MLASLSAAATPTRRSRLVRRQNGTQGQGQGAQAGNGTGNANGNGSNNGGNGSNNGTTQPGQVLQPGDAPSDGSSPITGTDPTVGNPHFLWPLYNPKPKDLFWAVPTVQLSNNKDKPLNVSWTLAGLSQQPNNLVLQWGQGVNPTVWTNITNLPGSATNFSFFPSQSSQNSQASLSEGQNYHLRLMDADAGLNPSTGGLTPIVSGAFTVYSPMDLSVTPTVVSASSPQVSATFSCATALTLALGITRRNLNGFVGFSNYPNQVHRRSVKRGFAFTLMVVGESGMGKSTLVNTLFNTAVFPDRRATGPANDIRSTVDITQLTAELQENEVNLKLSVIDTPGFGDFVNNEESWKPILHNLEARYDAYLEQEMRVNRAKIVDNRIHACIYFIPPTGHSLRQLDVEVMKRLAPRVNLIPVIAKADTLTDEEIIDFKARILDDIAFHKIQIYRPPSYEFDDDDTKAQNNEIISKIPFAVVGSTTEVTTPDGRRVRGRAYPWGVIEVDNEKHNDFVKLRQMLIRTHMEELKNYTNEVLYETYRTQKLLAMGRIQEDVPKEINPLVSIEEQRQAHESKLTKMENDMKLVFQQKVQEKEAKLKQSEEELYARHKEMREALEKQRAELEEKKKKLEALVLQQVGAHKPGTPEKARKKGFLSMKS
ncbi:Cell division control protein 3 [Sorochytrium milnesiophthora]